MITSSYLEKILLKIIAKTNQLVYMYMNKNNIWLISIYVCIVLLPEEQFKLSTTFALQIKLILYPACKRKYRA